MRGLPWGCDPLAVGAGGRACASGIEPEVAQTNSQEGKWAAGKSKNKTAPHLSLTTSNLDTVGDLQGKLAPSPRAAHTLDPAGGGDLAGAKAAGRGDPGLPHDDKRSQRMRDTALAATALASCFASVFQSHPILTWLPLTQN